MNKNVSFLSAYQSSSDNNRLCVDYLDTLDYAEIVYFHKLSTPSRWKRFILGPPSPKEILIELHAFLRPSPQLQEFPNLSVG